MSPAEARLKEVATVYQAAGVNGLQSWVKNQPPQVQHALYVRLENPYRNLDFVSFPEDWLQLRDVPDQLRGHRSVGVIRIPQNEQRDFIIASANLPDGSVLRIGRSTDSREYLTNDGI